MSREIKFTGDICLHCGNGIVKKHETGHNAKYFCSRACYFANKKTTGKYKGDGATNYKHGDGGSRLNTCWHDMKSRCLKKDNKSFKDYGGRGISICDEWLDFNEFKLWANDNGYMDNLTIERINVNGNYEPSNCTWITKSAQAKNKRNSKLNKVA